MPCSICKQPGHNKRSCPHANVTMRKTTTAKLKSMAKTFVSDDKDCCVCMSPIKSTNCCTTKCGHNFCLSCFFECAKRKPECPMCRTKLDFTVPLPANPLPEMGDDDFRLVSIGMFDLMNESASVNDVSVEIVDMWRDPNEDDHERRFNTILSNTVKYQIERKMLYWGYITAKTMYGTLKATVNPTNDASNEALRNVFDTLTNQTDRDTSVIDLTNP